jgi:N-acetylmuramic acid 6-phosphate etherase
MVDMRPVNAKLRGRAAEMVARIAGCSVEDAEHALRGTGWSIKEAVLVAQGASPADAARRIAEAGGHLRRAMER